jgi:hypothetical protein
MSNLILTPASEWRNKAELVKMPSGRVAKLRRANLLTMIRDGENVPNFLATKVTERLSGRKPANAAAPDSLEMARSAVDSVFFIAKAVFVYPRLVDGEPQADDEVCIADVPESDLAFAASYATGDAAVIDAVATFRRQAQADVESVQPGESVVAAS